MKLLSIQVGLPKEVDWEHKRVLTAIFKERVDSPVLVRKLSLEGDGQADLTVHGGLHKAVYAYSRDAYPWWLKTLSLDELPNGAFGENLTVEHLDERTVCVGDRFRLGQCELQASEPRFPCFKLGIKFGDMGILKTFIESGRPGIYFQVLAEGRVQRGDAFSLLERDPEGVSCWDFFDLKIRKYSDPALLTRLLRIKNLSNEWREKFQKHLP